MAKPKVAWYWCASCGGCEESFVDLAEKLLIVFDSVDIVFCPVAMDFKKSDVEAMPDKSITVSFINGGVRLEEHLEMVKLLRRKSNIVIAYGACSTMGGIPGLANLYNVEDILRRKYTEVPSVVNEGDIIPVHKTMVDVDGYKIMLELPKMLPKLYPLDQVITVDYYIPGCPPTPDVFWSALEALLGGNLPPVGSILGADTKALCDTCKLNDTKPEKILLDDLKRVYEGIPEYDKCLLAQGYLCLGPVTRGGCNALCINVGMPCTGCFGPLDDVIDYGGKALSYIATIIDLEDEEDLNKLYDKIGDWIGILYKYSLPASRLRGRVDIKESRVQDEVVDRW